MPVGDNPWIVQASQVKPEKRQWIWEGYFPIGELSIIAGLQGIGKSLITIKMASHITTGRPWPDGSKCVEGSVVFLSYEDDVAQTIVPRLIDAHADTERISIVRGVPDPRNPGYLIPFEIKRDTQRLASALEYMKQHIRVPPRMVVFDPIASYVGSIDSNRETQVRSVLGMMQQQIAKPFNVAILCIMHIKKAGGDNETPALERIMGSVAFTGTARTAWAFCQCPEDDDKRYLIPVKHNLIKRSIRGYEVFVATGGKGEGVIRWGKKATKLAEDLLIDRGMRPEAKREKAKEIIQEELKNGYRLASDVKEIVLMADISARTCDNAKADLKVVSVWKNGRWVWYLPGVSKPPVGKVKKRIEVESLVSAVGKLGKKLPVKKPVKSEKQLVNEEVVRCVREFENSELFAPPPED